MGSACLDTDLRKPNHLFGKSSVATVHEGAQFGFVTVLFTDLADLATYRDRNSLRFPLPNKHRQVGANLIVVSLLFVHGGIA